MAFNFSGQVVGLCLHPQYAGLDRLSCKFQIIAGLFCCGGAFHAGALIKEVGFSKGLMLHFPSVTNTLGCVIAYVPFNRVQILIYTPDDLDIDLEIPVNIFGRLVVARKTWQ